MKNQKEFTEFKEKKLIFLNETMKELRLITDTRLHDTYLQLTKEIDKVRRTFSILTYIFLSLFVIGVLTSIVISVFTTMDDSLKVTSSALTFTTELTVWHTISNPIREKLNALTVKRDDIVKTWKVDKENIARTFSSEQKAFSHSMGIELEEEVG